MHKDLRMSEADASLLREHCETSFLSKRGKETGAIGLVGECKVGNKHEYLIVKILLPQPGDLKVADVNEVVFDSAYIRRALLEKRRLGVAGIVFFHTHPFSDTEVAFSRYDDYEEPQLVENLLELEESIQVLSVVLGRTSQCGRVWLHPSQHAPLRYWITVGEQLEYLPLSGQPAPAPAPVAATFDRSLALSGEGAIGRMSEMTFGLVGASGTGSLLGELLVRGGAKKVMIADDDIVKDVNLNRILHSTMTDVKERKFKVDVLKRDLERIGLGCEIEAIKGSILDREVLARFREADVLIGCIDQALPRELLGQLSGRYILPYIDVGTEIGGDEAGISSVDSRVSYFAPGRHCLQCCGVVTANQLRMESMTSVERARQRRLGYSEDLFMTQPAVMDLNMRAASLGMLILRHLLQPFMQTPLPVMVLENMVTLNVRRILQPKSPMPGCPVCQNNKTFGHGDYAKQLGYDREQVLMLTSELTFEIEPLPEPGDNKL